jgi:hypothetical protein
MKLITIKRLPDYGTKFFFFSSNEFNAETHTKCREVENFKFNFVPVHIKCMCNYHHNCAYG